jgi:hypothetical protein
MLCPPPSSERLRKNTGTLIRTDDYGSAVEFMTSRIEGGRSVAVGEGIGWTPLSVLDEMAAKQLNRLESNAMLPVCSQFLY